MWQKPGKKCLQKIWTAFRDMRNREIRETQQQKMKYLHGRVICRNLQKPKNGSSIIKQKYQDIIYLMKD